MDQSSFDRIARLLGGAASRRAGLRAALGSLFGLSAAMPGAEADARRAAGKDQGTGKGRNRKPAKPEGPCGDRTRKDNLCTKDSQCCTGYCKKGLKNKDGKGRCRCLKKNQACKPSQTCCGRRSCTNGRCASGIPTGQKCTASDVCKNKEATCTVYTAIGQPKTTHCLLADGKACAAGADCVSAYCGGGVCGACPLIPTGSPTNCTSNAECCSGVCSIVVDPDYPSEPVGRCISATTVWLKLSWTNTELDLDSWTWLPASTPNESGTGLSFPNKGDVVQWQRLFYPWLTYAVDPTDSYSEPKTSPDVWLDVDDTSGPGVERTLIFQSIASGVYRFAVRNYSACPDDVLDTTACGPSWQALDTNSPVVPLNETDATVEVYLGGTVYRTFTVPTTVADPANSTHFYWWHVADIAFDASGEFASLTPGGGQPNGVLLTCAPAPYAMTLFIQNAQYLNGASPQIVSNYCPS
ncbi:MAG: hypothetical protein ACKOWF_01540 [Chloroflexota bacterium]